MEPSEHEQTRLKAVEEIQESISRLVRQVQVPALGEAVARETGISLGGPYFQALTRIVRDGPITVSRMARDLSTDISALSRNVTALEKRGLVRREQDVEDRRSYFLTATEEGQRVFDVLFTQWIKVLDDVIADWGDETVLAFADAFAAFVDRLSIFVDEAVQDSEKTRRL